MTFNSAAFLFVFFPAVFLLYRLCTGERSRTVFLCAAGLLFYAVGGIGQLPVLLLAALWNYVYGRIVLRAGRKKSVMAIFVTGNLALLCFYKYLGFVCSLLSLPAPAVTAPMGISFFTFHGISYIVDIHREKAEPERRFDLLLLYLAFFPRLLAGPIVSYRSAHDALASHPTDRVGTAEGMSRFVRGMAKKLLLSESAAAVVNAVWSLNGDALGAPLAWVGALGYCLQLYFDFSGYSDMAIGLGRMFGFVFPENFDHPYASVTLSEFWRRWHMTLNRWFVDYLYIPLGGSRRSPARNLLNKMLVFLCTGIWHGAGWTFILWGLWHGLFVSLEGVFGSALRRWQEKRPLRLVLRLYTLLIVVTGFVMFRSATVREGLFILGRMFSFRTAGAAGQLAAQSILVPGRVFALILGAILSFPVAPAIRARLGERAQTVLSTAGTVLLLVLCILALSAGGFSPFIYQQF